MQVTIIGSGNIATVLGRLLVKNGHTVLQVYSRNAGHADELAKQVGAMAIYDISLINKEADLYLLTVTDDALASVAGKLLLKDKLVIHTAGSVSKEILKTVSSNYGVLWPMKMIRKSMSSLLPVTIIVDGSSEAVTVQIEQLARQFSPAVTRADDSLRIKIHMLAAITSNFTNHLYHLAADYCEKEKIDFSFFYPLIEESAQRIQISHPKSVQAGPAFRGDDQTLEKHRLLLEQYPQIQKLYLEMSASIKESFTEKKPERGDG